MRVRSAAQETQSQGKEQKQQEGLNLEMRKHDLQDAALHGRIAGRAGIREA